MTAGAGGGQTEPEVVPFADQAAWEAWLADHHTQTEGVWLKMAKKATGIPSVTYPEALESALCYGWIDGQRKRLDDRWFIQRFTPRRARSNWSKVNVGKVERLVAEGRMRPPGLAEVERAKADGRWDRASDPPSATTVPDDFLAALDAAPDAAATFETLNKQNRFAIAYRIQDARRPETRAARIEQFVSMLAEGKTLY